MTITLKKDLASQNYLNRLVKGSHHAELIEFKEASFLAGAWDDVFGLVVIKDASNQPSANTSIVKQLSDYLDEQHLSLFNYPYKVKEYAEKEFNKSNITLIGNHELLEDKKNGCLISKDKIPKLPSWVDISNWTEHKCSADKLTPYELIKVISWIKEQDDSAQILNHLKEHVDSRYQNYLYECERYCVCLERQIFVAIHGNDDRSYHASVSSISEAEALVAKIKLNNSFDGLKKMGFISI